MSNFSPGNGNHITFLPSTMILKCSEGMYVTYTSEIFPDPSSKNQVFVERCLGLFLAELGLFLPFCARLCGRRGGLMLSPPDSRSSAPGSSLGQGTALCSFARH